jgi:hypothetical protein
MIRFMTRLARYDGSVVEMTSLNFAICHVSHFKRMLRAPAAVAAT